MSDTSLLDRTANPAPLGLLGFGMTTVLLNMHNAGWFELNAMILAMGVFYGGVVQILAGLLEWKKGNTFAATAFTSYGAFWLVLVTTILLPQSYAGVAAAAKETAFPAFLALWGLFTAVMFAGTLRLNRALQIVFGSLTVLFFLLAYADYSGSEPLTRLAGYEGIACGFSAIYTGLAQVINDVYGRPVLPLGPVRK